MKWLRLWLLLLLAPLAFAQSTGINGGGPNGGGGGTPGGSNNQLQINSNGTFGGVTNVSAGQCLLSTGTTSAPSFGSCSGTSGLAPSGTPAAHQVGIFQSSTTVGGVGPGTLGQALVSSGVSADPVYSSTLAAVSSVNGTSIPASATLLVNGGALGTPSSATLTNATGLPIGSGVSGLGTGIATFLATPSSANFAAAITGATGTGANVFGTAPTISSPTISTAATLGFITGATQCLHVNTAGAISGTGSDCGSGGSTAFSGLTSGTNTTMAAVVGTGASMTTSGSGTIAATSAPLSGVSGLGTGVATALGIAVGSAGAPVVNGGALGTPASGTLTNATGLPIGSGVSGLGTGVATFLATPSSANLASAVTGETGSGALVFGTSPSLTSPTIATGITFSFITGSTQCLQVNTSGALSGTGSTCGSGGSSAFSGITTGTNTTATMTVGSGASLLTSSGGFISANELNGATIPASAALVATNSSSQTTAVAIGNGLTINSATLSPTYAINAQTGTSYTISCTSDAAKLLTLNNASAVAVSLPQATSSCGAGFSLDIENLGAGTVTITPTTSTINGSSTLTIAQNRGCSVTSDGTNYQVAACTALVSGGSGVTSVGLTMPSGFTVSGSPVTTSGTLAVTTSLSGVLKGTGSAFTTAAAADIYGLWSGTCSSTTFLRGDGSCQTPAGGGNVSTSGTPSAGQIAVWASSTTAQGQNNLPIGVNAATSATSVTPNCTFDVVTVTASTTGTFTVNAPGTCTPVNGQRLRIEVLSPSGGTVTYAFNAAFKVSATLALPTTSNAASKEDDFEFEYSSRLTGWKLMAYNQGF